MRAFALAAAVALWPVAPAAQGLDTLHVDLDALQVTASRLRLTAADAPIAVAIETRAPVTRATEPGESLESVLRHLPGLWVADRENFALGERLSVRGMGARAGFGVRGVQVVLDGIPLTMADGQSSLVIADPALIRRAELIRGPASTLWGNASGGVLFLSTIPTETLFAEGRLIGGSFGMLRGEVELAHPLGDGVAGLAIGHTRRDGFREHSAYEVTRGRAFSRMDLGNGAALTTIGAFEWAPHQEHPGALTAEQFADDPRQAQPNFVAQRAGKDSRQGQVGVALTAHTSVGLVAASVFGVVRRLENPLPFAYIDLDRVATGLRLAIEREDGPTRWTAGVDAAMQRDDRQNWANLEGSRGELRLDQIETVTGAAAFSQGQLTLGALALSAGIRYDMTRFAADDRFQAEADQSGRRALGAFSPAAGISYRLGTAVLFASAGTAFETPTTTELVNRPDGAGGFNPELEPQRTRGIEAGARGTDRSGRLYFDLAAFRLLVTDQLTAFEGADGRTYFRNAEATTHDGLEAMADWHVAEWLRLGATYGWSRFAFAAASGELAGNRLPGVPEHRLSAHAHLRAGDFFGRASALVAGPMHADDANTARIDGFAVVDLRLGYSGGGILGARLLPFLQVRNLLDARYAGSVALNAAAGRYLEPAAGRSIQLGLSARVIP